LIIPCSKTTQSRYIYIWFQKFVCYIHFRFLKMWVLNLAIVFVKMKPSLSRHELKNQTSNNKTYKKDIECPYGTIPVLRNTKEFNTKAQLLAAKYFNPLSADSPGTHVRIHFSVNTLDLIIYYKCSCILVDRWGKATRWSISWYRS